MDTASPCQYGALLPSNFPHIMEQIFLLMDYESFKICFEVCKPWRDLLMSDSFQRKAKHAFSAYIVLEGEKLVRAARHGKTKLIKKLLSTKLLDINCLRYTLIEGDDYYNEDEDRNYQRYDWSAPLFEAADNGHADAVRLLLDRGAKPDNLNSFGLTALQLAVGGGHKEVVKLLIECGANINILYDDTEDTLLHDAAMMGYQDIIQILLDSGADPNITNGNGETPLSIANGNEHECIEHLLLERGARPNQQYYEQKLLVSIREGNVKDVESRLLGGVDVNYDHSTPLRVAIYFSHKDIVLLLLSSGANPNPTMEEGNEEYGVYCEWDGSPLTVALRYGKRDLARILLDAGAEPTEEDKELMNEWSSSSDTHSESDSDTRSHSESDSETRSHSESDSETRSHSESDADSPFPSEADLGRGKRQTSIKEYFVKK